MPDSALQRNLIVALRLALGWVFLYAGATQLATPGWSAAGFLSGAKSLAGFYALFTEPAVLPITNFLVTWGHTLIGIALILGLGMRLATGFGALLMILYYVPRLDFPMVGPNNFIVEYHLVYAMMLVYLGSVHAGRMMGLERWALGLPPVRNNRWLAWLLA